MVEMDCSYYRQYPYPCLCYQHHGRLDKRKDRPIRAQAHGLVGLRYLYHSYRAFGLLGF